MKRLILFTWMGVCVIFAEPQKGEPPFMITSLMSTQPPDWHFTGKDDSNHILKCFKLHFKVVDPSVTSLKEARIYLYNQNKELVHTLATIEAKGDQMLGIPNVITTLAGLNKLTPNKVYSLIYTYDATIIKWNYAIAVIGVDRQFVAKIQPMTDLNGFDFKEKSLLIK